MKGVYEGRADVAEGLLEPALPWAAGLRTPVERAEPSDPAGETVTIGTYTGRSEMPEVAAALQQQLQKAGFKVKLDVREYASIESDALAGRFDAFVLSHATVLCRVPVQRLRLQGHLQPLPVRGPRGRQGPEEGHQHPGSAMHAARPPSWPPTRPFRCSTSG
ncbi:hypothetical protein ABZY30_26365 [Streptomyces massasporeus]